MAQTLRSYNVWGPLLGRAEPLPPSWGCLGCDRLPEQRPNQEHLLPIPLTVKLTHVCPTVERNLVNSCLPTANNHSPSRKGVDRPRCLSRGTFQCIPSSKSHRGPYTEDRVTPSLPQMDSQATVFSRWGLGEET